MSTGSVVVPDDFASAGVQRVMALTLQTAALILLVLNLPGAIAQASSFPWWWTASAAAAVVVPAFAILLLGLLRRTRRLRTWCGVQSVAMVLAVFAAPLALQGAVLPAGAGMPWIQALAVIAGAAAAVAWSWLPAVSANIALQLGIFLLAAVTVPSAARQEALGNAIVSVFFVTLFAVLAAALKRAGFRLDDATRTAVTEATKAAEAEARRTARRRIAALIHDSVIVALFAYADPRVDLDLARDEARRALEAVEQLDVSSAGGDREPTELAWELQAMTTRLDPMAVFDYTTTDDGRIPAAASAAILEASSEALRNSIRHAPDDRPVARQVDVVASASTATVLILDDGAGFDLAAVPLSRLGIRHGIIARMTAAGGRARVVGIIGRGTLVELTWSRP
ncbi:hypothetical protein [Amnibacterium sp.]|uniref:hypothetical protein n=1 Tax=Amnibacterium sp. TaxID=1872496 RepID=UPI003F7C6479